MRYVDAAITGGIFVSAILINYPYWGSNRVGQQKRPGGFAF